MRVERDQVRDAREKLDQYIHVSRIAGGVEEVHGPDVTVRCSPAVDDGLSTVDDDDVAGQRDDAFYERTRSFFSG